MDPRVSTYIDGTPNWILVHGAWAGTIAVLCLIATFWIVGYSWKYRNSKLLYLTTFLWAFIPPAGFWFEYFFMYRIWGATDTFDLFTYGQQISAALWASVVASLLVIGSSDRIKKAIDSETDK